MSDNLVLEPLRAIRGDMAQLQTDMAEVKERLGFLAAGYALLSRRVDRLFRHRGADQAPAGHRGRSSTVTGAGHPT